MPWPFVREVEGPTGNWIVRGEPRGVSPTPWYGPGWWLPRLRRWATRDSAWVVRVRERAHDPAGPSAFESEVQAKADVEAELERVAAALRSGELGVRP